MAVSCTAAVIQMNSGANTTKNLADALSLMTQAVEQSSAKLLVLPENFLYFGRTGLAQIANNLSDYLNPLRVFAKTKGVTIVAGSIPHPSALVGEGGGSHSARFYSRSLVIDSSGELAASYDKCHLFDVDVEDGHAQYRESDSYTAGSQSIVADADSLSIGLSICYDVRFAGLYQRLSEQGAQIITVPSAFTAVTGRAHWDILLRARAIETQCFILAANQWGEHGKGRETWGHSMIVGPWGNILAECDDGVGFCAANLDFSLLNDIRRKIPVRMHRKF